MHRLVAGDELDDIVGPYLAVERRPHPARPWVLANMVGGLDGTAAFGGRVGPLSEGADVELFRLLRATADVVLVGASTVRAEGYGPVRLAEDRQQARVEAGRAPIPPLAVVSRSLQLDWSAAAFTAVATRTLVVTTDDADPDALGAAAEVADVVRAGAGAVDLAAALAALGELGHEVVLCEGGPTLLGELVAQDLLDELCLTVAPVMGGDPLPVAVTGVGSTVRRFALRHVAADDSSLFLRYERPNVEGDDAGGR